MSARTSGASVTSARDAQQAAERSSPKQRAPAAEGAGVAPAPQATSSTRQPGRSRHGARMSATARSASARPGGGRAAGTLRRTTPRTIRSCRAVSRATLVIRLAPQNRARPIQLLQHDHAGQLVRQRQRAQAPAVGGRGRAASGSSPCEPPMTQRHRAGRRASSAPSRRASSSLLQPVPSRASATSRAAGRQPGRAAGSPPPRRCASTVGARLASCTSTSRDP